MVNGHVSKPIIWSGLFFLGVKTALCFIFSMQQALRRCETESASDDTAIQILN